MLKIEPIYLTTTFIIRLKGAKESGTATGFFYSDDYKNLYVVTNKHVIYGKRFSENPEPEISKLKLLLHTNPNDLTQHSYLEIPLLSKGKKIWMEHSNPNVDVVLIPVDLDRKEYIIAHTDRNLIECENILIKFEKIYVMGYPRGWFDRKHNLPVTRIGHLSSPYGVPFNGQPIMIGDVETHDGMSGSPVFMDLKDYVVIEGDKRLIKMGSSKTVLIGIHSGQPIWRLKKNDTGEEWNEKHTLANIWFANLITEIIRRNTTPN